MTDRQQRTLSHQQRAATGEELPLCFIATSAVEGREVVISVLGELDEFRQVMDISPADGKLVVVRVETTPKSPAA